MSRRRCGWVVGVAMAAALVATPAASGQVSAGPCPASVSKGAECATFPVPLDHANPAGRTLKLAFARYPATGTRRGVVVLLAGGPGQAAIPLAEELARGALRGLHRSYDLVFADQRGTGASSPLTCSTAPHGTFAASSTASGAKAAEAVATCAAELGDARRFYSTPETVADLEDLRTVLGVDRIVPLGVSYGGQVAGEYARLHPEHTQALVLDSTSPIEGIDALGALPQLALPRVLREVCFPPGCEKILGEPQKLLDAAVLRIGAHGTTGKVVLPSGRTRTGRITVAGLYALVMSSDTDPALRTALPAALEAAGHGDAAPLLRLAAAGASGGGAEGDVNEVRFLATACAEGRLPWDPRSDPASRPALLAAALQQNAGAYAPFPIEAIAPQLPATLCLGWPPTPKPPLPADTASGPDLPVLVLGGREDLRTPLEDQRRAAAQFPDATVVAVPNTGHSTIGSDLTGCASGTLDAFLLGAPRPACRRSARLVPLALPVFRSVSALPGAAGSAPKRVEQTAVAADLTLRDVTRQLAGLAIGTPASPAGISPSSRTIRIGGLRAGRLEVRGTGIRLVGYSVVPGVALTGRLSGSGTGTVLVGGPRAAAGTIMLRRSGGFRGVLGGVAITYRPRPAGSGS